MPKLPSTERLAWEKISDLKTISHLLSRSASVHEIMQEHPDWNVSRIKRAIKNYQQECVLRSLQERPKSTVLIEKPLQNAPEITKSAKTAFKELHLNLSSTGPTFIVVIEATLLPQNVPFLENLIAFCAAFDITFMALARPGAREKAERFHPVLQPYLVFSDVRVSDELLLLADPKKSRDALDPITHLMTANGGKHVVVSHPRVAMRSIARMACDGAHFAWSTGSASLAVPYAEPAQSQALFIQVAEDGVCFFHQLKSAVDGSFQYLNHYVADAGRVMIDGVRVKAIHWADGHFDVMEPGIKEACFAPGGLLDQLCPEYQIFDDILNFTDRAKFSRTATEMARQYHLGRGSVRKEFEETAAFLNSVCRDWTIVYKVEDNHGARFIEWCEGDQRRDPVPGNSKFWAEMVVAKHQMIEDDPQNFRLAYLEHEAMLICGLQPEVGFIYRGQSLSIDGVQHGVHFHKGINGSPGSAAQYKALGYPIVGGHPHSPRIDGSVISVGTCGQLDERWDPDVTTKAHGHAIQYANGHVVLVTQHPDGRIAAGPLVRVGQEASSLAA